MSNDSSTGGHLLPAGAAPIEDDALAAALQQYVVGMTGLPGNLVRPRWQSVVPKQPEPSVTWCAVGVTKTKSDDYPSITHNGDGEGSDILRRHQTLTALISFYGPQGQAMAAQLRDGAYIPQNNDQLKVNGLSLLDVGEVLTAPDLVNQQWVRRYDLTIRLRREITRIYPVLNVLSAEGTFNTDSRTVPFATPL